MKDDNVQKPPITPEEIRPANPGPGKRSFIVLALGFTFLVLAAANPAPIQAAWAEFERIIQLRSDPSPNVREGAACAIAQSGMFTQEQRLRAVPGLLQMTDDATLDPATRSRAFQALRDITGAGLGANHAAWRDWWSHHGRR